MPSRTFHSDPIGDVWYDSAGAGGVASYGSPDEDSWGHTGAFYVGSSGSISGGSFTAIENSYGHKNTGVKS